MRKINAKYINFFTLLLCVILLFALRAKKQLYFDEPFQIMACHGFCLAHMEPYEKDTVLTSKQLAKEDNVHAAFTASTDSIHYTVLFYVTKIFGRDLNVFVFFSLFFAAASLIAFYKLGQIIFGDTLAVSLSLLIFFTGMMFLPEAYSVRHYILALFFTILSSIYFFKLLKGDQSKITFLLFMISVDLAIMFHFLTVSVMFTFFVFLLFKRRDLLSNRFSLVSGTLLFSLLCFYLHFHNPIQSSNAVYKCAQTEFVNNRIGSNMHIFSLFAKNIGLCFHMYFVIFKDNLAVRVGSLVVIFLLLVIGATESYKNRNTWPLYLQLSALSICSSLLVLFTAIHYKMTYVFDPRFILFSYPFSCLLIAYYVHDVYKSKLIPVVLFTVLFAVPMLFRFFNSHFGNRGAPCNHLLVIERIKKCGVHNVTVPEPVDAIFINSLMPAGYDITFRIDKRSADAVLFSGCGTERIPLIKNDLIVLF